MTVALIDYGSGNLRSAAKALERAASVTSRSDQVIVTADPAEVLNADRIVLPGVGAFADCIAGLRALDGMIEAMDEAVHRRGRPFLGICVGMQLLADVGREYGDHSGLGWIGGEVVALEPGSGLSGERLTVPHMGWNTITIDRQGHPVLSGFADETHFYFVHSYHLRTTRPEDCMATTEYAGRIAAVIGRDTIIGCQFHPEKSQAMGLRLITNFLEWTP